MSRNSYAIETIKEQYKSRLNKPDVGNFPRVQRVLDYIHLNLFSPMLTIQQVKEECHIHNKSFTSKFEISTNYTPKSYILYHRIEASKQLLWQTDLTITTIAVSIGFASLSSFDKAFQTIVGQKPSAWRIDSDKKARER